MVLRHFLLNYGGMSLQMLQEHYRTDPIKKSVITAAVSIIVCFFILIIFLNFKLNNSSIKVKPVYGYKSSGRYIRKRRTGRFEFKGTIRLCETTVPLISGNCNNRCLRQLSHPCDFAESVAAIVKVPIWSRCIFCAYCECNQ